MLLAALLSVLAQGVSIPANDGWVTDLARLLTPEQEEALENLCESYRAGTGREIAVLTLPDLDGQPPERVALEVGRAWEIGSKEKEDGALLLVSRDDKKIRIEVERGLEGEITDSISGRIIREKIAPRFRENDYYGGLRAGLEAIHAAAGGEYAPVAPDEPGGGPSGLGSLVVLLFVIVLMSRLASRRRRGFGLGAPPIWLGPTLGSRGSGLGGGFGRGFGGGGGGGGGGFRGFGGGGGFRGGGATGGW